MAKVFQYGSNADEARFNSEDRLNGAAANGKSAQTVDDYDLVFDVWSTGNNCAASDLVQTPGRKAWGILYDVPDDRIGPSSVKGSPKTLTQIEGSSYAKRQIKVTCDGQAIDAVTFLVIDGKKIKDAATSADYVRHIVRGLRSFAVPEDYVDHVIDIAIENIKSARPKSQDELVTVKQLRLGAIKKTLVLFNERADKLKD